MRMFSVKRGDNLVEYAIILALIGVAFGYSLLRMDPNTFARLFKNSFSSTSQSGGGLTVGPIE